MVEISPKVELNVNAAGSLTIVPFDPSKSTTQLVFAASRIETWYVAAGNALKVALDCHVPVPILYSKVPDPPVEADTTIEPVEVPLQVAFEGVAVAVIGSN